MKLSAWTVYVGKTLFFLFWGKDDFCFQVGSHTARVIIKGIDSSTELGRPHLTIALQKIREI